MKIKTLMIRVKLQFSSLFELWDFKQIIKNKARETLFVKRSLTCDCTEAEIELAVYAYHAQVEKLHIKLLDK